MTWGSRNCLVASFILLCLLCQGARSDSWRDTSPHKSRLVRVESDVELEVLDWGGSGRPVVLLAGQGHTAHVFDDFALKLKPFYRVYGITRRGYGISSVPESGYSASRLGDDVLAVIKALGLKKKPVLIGHSRAGEELSSVVSRYPEAVAGVVYLDAAYKYAFFAPEGDGLYGLLEWEAHWQRLQNNLLAFRDNVNDPIPVARELLDQSLPAFQKDLELFVLVERGRPPRPAASPADLKDFKTVQAWYARGANVTIPEAEFRQMLTTDAEGHPTMTRRFPRRVGQAIQAGEEHFTNIQGPVLAIFAMMDDTGDPTVKDASALAAADAFSQVQRARATRRSEAFKRGVPQAQIVLMPKADHYVFLSHEQEVLQEIRAFVSTLR